MPSTQSSSKLLLLKTGRNDARSINNRFCIYSYPCPLANGGLIHLSSVITLFCLSEP